jgi:alkylated DNA nucleotide flippase Atl1
MSEGAMVQGVLVEGVLAEGAMTEGADDVPDLPRYAELVLDAVDRIPPGRVLTYGDIAELVGEGGPRQVGAVMSRYGSLVPWWRVLHADGTPPVCHDGRALAAYRAEGTPLRPGGRRVDMRTARWDGR